MRCVAEILLLLGILTLAACESDDKCKTDDDCAPDQRCLFVGNEPEASYVCVRACVGDSDCPDGEGCTGRAAPGPGLMMTILYCE